MIMGSFGDPVFFEVRMMRKVKHRENWVHHLLTVRTRSESFAIRFRRRIENTSYQDLVYSLLELYEHSCQMG